MKGPGRRDKSLAGLRNVFVEDEVPIADDAAEELAQLGAAIMGPAGTLSQAEAPSTAARGSTSPVLDINLRWRMVYGLADRLIARGVAVVFATVYDRFVMPERRRDSVLRKPEAGDSMTRVLNEIAAASDEA